MNMLKRLGLSLGQLAAGYREAVSAPVRQSYDPTWFARGLDAPSIMQEKVTRPYAQSPYAHRAVRVIADIVAGIALQFFPAGANADEVDALPDDNPVVKTFMAPMDRMSGAQLIARTTMDLMLFGNAVWLPDGEARISGGNVGQFPRFLVPLPMTRTQPWLDQRTGKFIGVRVSTAGGQRTFPLDQIVHFAMENPYSDAWGMSEVDPVMAEMEAAHAATQTNLRLLRRGGPGVVIERTFEGGGLIGPEADESIKQELDEGFAGEDEHGSLLLPPGQKLVKSGATQREMDFEKLIRLNRETIGGALGSVPALQGILEYANYANMGAQLEYVYQFTAFPMTQRIEGVIQSQLLDRYRVPIRAQFDRSGCRALYQNLSSLASTAKTFVDMRIPFAEVNRRLKLGFDLDEYPWLFVDPGPEQAALLPVQGAPAVIIQRELGRSAKWLKIVTMTEQPERQVLGAWRAHLDWMLTQTITGLAKRQSLDDSLPPRSAMERDALSRTEGPLRQAAVAGSKSVAASVDAPVWKLLDPRVTKIVMARNVSIKGAAGAAADRMRQVISDGVKGGDSIDTMEAALRAKHREEYVGQARVVARTEAMSGFSGARQVSFSEAGISKHEWLSARDEAVRPGHSIDGEVVKMGAPFSNGLAFPHDPAGPAEEVINCRCVTIPVIE